MHLLRRLALLVVLALAAASGPPAVAEEPTTSRAVVETVVAAAEAGDEEELRRLSRLDKPDAWGLAELLAREGRLDLARRVAELAHPGDVRRLGAYLDRLERDGIDEAAIAANRAYEEALRTEGGGEALRVLEAFEGPFDTVPAVVVLEKKAIATLRVRGFRAAAPLMEEAWRAAEALGWLAQATEVLRRTNRQAHAAGWESELSRYTDEALRIAALRERPDVARADRLNQASALLVSGRTDEARALLLRLLAEFEAAGELREVAYCRMSLGNLADRAGEYDEAIAEYRSAHTQLVAIGDRPMTARVLANLGGTLTRAGRTAEALDVLSRARDLFDELGEAENAARTEGRVAALLGRLGDRGEAVKRARAALEDARAGSSTLALAEALMSCGVAYHVVGDTASARAYFREALDLLVDGEAVPAVLTLLRNLSNLSHDEAQWEETVALHQRALESLGERVEPLQRADVLESFARHLARRRARERALTQAGQAAALRTEHGSSADVARSHMLLGDLHAEWRELPAAVASYERARELWEQRGETTQAARLALALGTAYLDLGRMEEATAAYRTAVEVAREVEDPRLEIVALGNLSLTASRTGRLAEALDHGEAAVARAKETANADLVAEYGGQLGSLRHRIGDYERALELHLTAEAELRRLSLVRDALGASRNAAVVLMSLGRTAEARRRVASVLTEAREGGYRGVELFALNSLGAQAMEAGDTAKATEWLEAALVLATELSDATSRALSLQNLGLLAAAKGDSSTAGERLREALDLWHDMGHAAGEAGTRIRLAGLELDAGRAESALAIAREGIERLPLLTQGLADEERARARDQWYTLYEVGYRAAAALGHSEAMVAMVEGSRAAGLRRSLRSGDADDARHGVDPALIEREVAARAALVAARAEAEAALSSRGLKATREARDSIEVAEEELLAAAAAVQRAARRSETVAVAEPAKLREIQRALDRDQVLVLHMGADDQLHALVITRRSFRLVELGPQVQVYETVLALVGGDPRTDLAEPIARLRSLLAEPLELGDDARHVLVSPSAATAYAPLSLLHPDRRVSAVPSGTALVQLTAARTKPGKQILSLGDPQYEAADGDGAPDQGGADPAANRGGLALLSRLARLPGTAAEAEAVGDRVLLGAEATESGLLAALAEQKRWRAIHLACHGLVDVDRPLLSGLALTPGGGDDGLLTCVDLGRADFIADLVVLSACETARGRVFRAEGVMGLTSAFLSSGASSVVSSLWKVDDRATQALMTRFYELWNPERGKGLPAAEALRQAQEHVRSKPEWSHPAYWAAWVLWGRPD